MITNPRLEEYIEIISPGNSLILESIRKDAVKNHIPIIKKDTQELIKVLLAMNTPKKILEVGCAVGYSTLVMAENTSQNTTIDTVEKMSARVKAARENVARLGFENRIAVYEGDAGVFLKRLLEENKQYDFIFMDAAKAQYINWLEDIIRLMKRGGVLVSDNCLQGGDVLESAYSVKRRDRTIHSRMRDYLYTLTNSCELRTAILPVGDGVTVSVKR